ncbi:MAG: CHASE2 domain-containing protein, partial [Verrucomicrobiae bacterium]|nr:CHASE2 domain-containing protein [Verrucomicrobiae bacterium]
MKLPPARIVPAAITVAVLALVGVADWLSPEFLRRFEWITYDWRVRKAFETQQPISTNLAAIFVDDESMQVINEEFDLSWPWPRVFHGRLVDELKAQHVSAVGFDIFFIESMRCPEDATMELGGRTYSSDEWLSRAIGLSSNVFLGVPGQTISNVWSAVAPHAMFRSRAAGLGLAVSDRDTDGVLRRAKPFRDDPELGRIWHLGIVMASRLLKLDLDNAVIRDDRIELFGPGGIRRVIPTDEEGFFDIDWSIAWNDPRMTKGSFEEILNMEADHAEGNGTAGHRLNGQLAGKLVFVGSIAAGNNVSDVGASP